MTATAERSYTHMDKSDWGDGPWQAEPDKLQWIDSESSLDCLIVRNRLGALCGYVGVPPEHPAHGLDYDDLRVPTEDSETDYPDVHGGLTYADKCQEGADEAKGICHVPMPGRPGDVWWFGFDCAHMNDIAPGMEARERAIGHPPMRFAEERYRDVDYVRRECASLAAQLARATGGKDGP